MEPILLLHGAIGAPDQLQPLAEALSGRYEVHVVCFSGHGGKLLGNGKFSIELFAHDVLSYMEQKGLERVSVFGYSMGGYVAMYLARNYPERITRVVTLATKYHWDEATAAREVQNLNPEKIEQKIPAFADALRRRHAPLDWVSVLANTAQMMQDLGAGNTLSSADYPLITIPVLLLLGDRDKMVTLDETLAVYKALPASQLGILPATPHPIEQVDASFLAMMIWKFVN